MSYDFLLQHHLVRAAERFPSRLAVICGDQAITYAELHEVSDRVCAGLRRAGVERGDRVVVWAGKGPRTIAAWFGALKAGAAYVPIDRGTTTARLTAIVERSRPKLVVVEPGGPEEPSRISIDRLIDAPPPSSGRDAPDGIDLDWAWIHFTSGSTGVPKGAAISHRAAAAYLDAAGDLLEASPDEVVVNHAPLSFDLASFDAHLAVRRGATLHMIPELAAIAPGSVLAILRDARPTILYTVPTTLHRLAALREIEDLRFPTLRHLIFAGEPPQVESLRRLRPVFPNATMHHWYGATEAPLVSAIAYPPGRELPDVLPLGDVVPDVEIGLLGADDRIVEPTADAEGELVVAGTPLLSAYCGSPEETAAAVLEVPSTRRPGERERWYRTRDVVKVDAGRRLFYVGRADRMVKVIGMRVDPAEIEAAALRCPGVAECAVVPRRDPQTGARLFALFVGDAQPGALLDHLRRELPRYMVPERCFALGELPVTATGKIDRTALGVRLQALLDEP